MKKGITPVISVILLLLIAVALVGFAMTFFTQIGTGASSQTDERLTEQNRLGNQKLIISSASINGQSLIAAKIVNTGTVELRANEVTVSAKNAAGTAIGTIGRNAAAIAVNANADVIIADSTCTTGTVATVTATAAGGWTDEKTITC